MKTITHLDQKEMPSVLKEETLQRITIYAILQRLADNGGNRTHTARSLGIERRTLCRWLGEWKRKKWVVAALVKCHNTKPPKSRLVNPIKTKQVGPAI